MSSIVDAVINSDNIKVNLGIGKKEAPRVPNGRRRQRSSPRPQGPPSESNGHLSDVEGFPDDEVVGVRGTDRSRARNPMDRAVPKVVDEVGEKVAEEFENFLDGYDAMLPRVRACKLILVALLKIQPPLAYPHPVL